MNAWNLSMMLWTNLPFPKEFIVKLILQYNIFEFNSELFLKMIGTAIGIRPAPSYANILMAKIDDSATKLAALCGNRTHPVKAWKRFLDEIYILWTGWTKKLHEFLDTLNQVHPTIKFTISHTTFKDEDQPCQCTPSNSL